MNKSRINTIGSIFLTVILILSILLGFIPAVKVNATDTKFEYYSSGDDTTGAVGISNGAVLLGQTFTPQANHYLTSVKLKIYRVGTPGTINCFIFATSGGLPVAPYLRYDTHDGDTLTTNAAGEWIEFTFSAQPLTAGTKYAIVLQASDGDNSNYVGWRYDGTSPTYTRGNVLQSIDSGVSFEANTGADMMFEEYGTLPVTVPTLTTEAADDITATTATGNATITSLGNGTVTKRGIVYSSTDTTPTIAEGADYVEETGTFTTGAYTESLTGLSTGVTYYARGYAYNSAGYGYGSVVNFTCTVSAPEITALAASAIAKTSARMNSIVNSDGGEECEVRFGWGDDSPATFDDYDTITDWIDGFTTSQQPYIDLTGLTASTQYFYSVQIKNSDSTVTSADEIDFTTLDAVSVGTNFQGNPTATTVNLSWIKGAGATNTMIRYSFTSYPATTADGIELYFSTGSSTVHTGLTAGTVVYYSLWSESGSTYSASAANLLVTTLAGTSSTPDDITEPTNWFVDTDYTTMSNFFFYDTVNDIADGLSMPYNTVWFFGATLVSVIVGFMFFTWTKGKILISAIALIATMGIFTAAHLLPMFLIFIVVVIIGGIAFSRRSIA